MRNVPTRTAMSAVLLSILLVASVAQPVAAAQPTEPDLPPPTSVPVAIPPTTAPAPPTTTSPPPTTTPSPGPTPDDTAVPPGADASPTAPPTTVDPPAEPPVDPASSPDGVAATALAAPRGALTFSGYAVGTPIRDQYRTQGIRFSGDRPFITSDRSNPTSPVLSGSPVFHGEIRGTFITPRTGAGRTVDSFSLDVGYIDNPGSVKVIVYGASGQRLGQMSADRRGIVRLTSRFRNAAAFVVKALSGEPAGFAIDNVVFPGSKRQTVVAMGDSYSSGEGNPPFDASSGECRRSAAAWPRRLIAPTHMTLRHIACSGAETTAFRRPFKREVAQATQLARIPNVGLVTITIGGNDAGFANVLRNCFLHNCVNSGRIAGANRVISRHLALDALIAYRAARQAAPNARVVVVGYPRIFPQSAEDENCFWLANNERRALNALSKKLDDTLRGVAGLAGAEYVSTLGVLAGHELCTSNPWVYTVGPFGGDLRGHPLINGQLAMATPVRARVGLR